MCEENVRNVVVWCGRVGGFGGRVDIVGKGFVGAVSWENVVVVWVVVEEDG